ncbi:MAG: DUF5688 family protein [Lachnospiraceae bacterium]|nr:DUF5688 family protein [Lachnospiraceae bacterium]
MMNYEEFKEYVKENIINALPNQYAEFEVSIRKSMKNNGLELDGLCIHGHDSISPVIYLNGYYEKYNDGEPLGSILSDISETYTEHMQHRTIPSDVLELVQDIDHAKEHIHSRLVNTKNNPMMLEGRPHTNFEDLSITYHIEVSRDDSGMASIPITNELAEGLGVTAEDLEKIAVENMPRNNPMVFRNMMDVVKDMIIPDLMDDGMSKEQAESMFEDMFQVENEKMFVLSNDTATNGAIWMTRPEALEEISERVGGDYFVLPSSIHEVIIVADLKFDKDALQDMVISVNQGQVRPEERLSDNVYAYDSKEHKLSLVTGDRDITHEKNQELVQEEEKKHSSMKH